MKKRIWKRMTATGVKLLLSFFALLLVLTGCNVPTPTPPAEPEITGTEQPTESPTEQPTEHPTEQPTEQETEPPVPALLPPGGVPTDELVAEISAAYEQKTGHTWKYRYEEYHHGDDPVQAITNYYGTYGDCAVLYDEGDIIDVRDIMVGEYRFQAGSPLFIDVYRNGEICTLQEAYDNGWITNEQLREIWVYHYLTRGIVGIQENPPPA